MDTIKKYQVQLERPWSKEKIWVNNYECHIERFNKEGLKIRVITITPL